MDWERELITQVGRAIDARRAHLGLSLREVAERTKELGHPISRTAIGDYSRPERRPSISIADLLVLAKALETPPILLLFPGPPGGEVTYLPNEHDLAGYAALTFMGKFAGFGDAKIAAFTTVALKYFEEAVRMSVISTAEEDGITDTAFLVELYEQAAERMRASARNLRAIHENVGQPLNLEVSSSEWVPDYVPSSKSILENGTD